jgi:hypothetical protein
MGMFKRAAVRGMAHTMVRRNVIAFPSKLAMDAAVDAVADSMPMPELPEGGHDPEQVAVVAQKLMEIAHQLQEQAGIGTMPGAPPEATPLPKEPPGGGPPSEESKDAAKEAAWLHKSAAYLPVEQHATDAVVAIMHKTAAEEQAKQANASGALMHGGDKPNTAAEAAKNDSVAALDRKQRPDGEYTGTNGHTSLETAKGELGHQGAATVQPTNSPSGTNSVNSDAHKQAALRLRAALSKQASSLIGVASPGSTKNKENDAAMTDSVAKLDLKNRPAGAYQVSPGGANFSEPQAARIGTEQKHPMAPTNTPSGTNSVMQASKLSAEDEAFVLTFRKCASDVMTSLPEVFTEAEKIAAVKAMMGLDRDGRQAWILDAHAKVAAAKTNQNTDHNKYRRDPEHKDEIGDPQTKESALLDAVRAAANTPAA